MPLLTSRGLAVALGAAAALVSGLVTGAAALVVLGVAFGALVVGAATSLWVGRESGTVQAHVELRHATLLQHTAATARLSFSICEPGATGSLLVEDPAGAWVGDDAPGGSRPTAGAGDSSSVGRGTRWRIVRVGRLCRVPPPAGEAATIDVAVPTGRRGLRVLRPCPVWRADGLSLVARQVGTTPSVPVLVCPSPTAVAERGLPDGDDVPAAATAGLLRSAPANEDLSGPAGKHGAGDEWTGLAAYAPGDRLAAVHWPHSLRRGRLLVRELSTSSTEPLTVIVDLSTTAPVADVDRVVGAAAGIGIAALRQGRAVVVGAWHGGATCRVADAGSVPELLALLARVETMGGGPGRAVTRRGDDIGRGVVVFSRDAEVRVRGTLAPGAGRPLVGVT